MKWNDRPIPFVPEEAPTKVIVVWMITLFVLIIVAMITAKLFWVKDGAPFWMPYKGGTTAPFSQRQAPKNDGPRLQVDEFADIKAYRAQQETLLTTYGWVDKGAGKVRIPVERAMERLLEKGLPVRGGAVK